MAYKDKELVVTSIPLSKDHSDKLNMLAEAENCKSRTQMGKKILEDAIDAKYVEIFRKE